MVVPMAKCVQAEAQVVSASMRWAAETQLIGSDQPDGTAAFLGCSKGSKMALSDVKQFTLSRFFMGFYTTSKVRTKTETIM